MSTLNMNSIQEALKTYYLEGMRYQMNEKVTPFYQKIDKTSKNISGVDIELALRYGRQGGIGNRPDDTQAMPTPNSRKTKKAKWGTKNIFATIRLTDKVIKATKDSKNAFASMLELELSDALTDAKDNFNRQLFGDGTGAMSTVSTASTVATNVIPLVSARFFTEGQLIDLIDHTDDSVIASEREVLVVDDVLNTITISGTAVEFAEDDIIAIAGSYGQELTGLGSIFDVDSTIYGIDRSTNKWLNPYVMNNNGDELSFMTMQSIIDKIETRSGQTIDFLMSSYGVRRAFIYLFSYGQRTVNTLDLEGGLKIA